MAWLVFFLNKPCDEDFSYYLGLRLAQAHSTVTYVLLWLLWRIQAQILKNAYSVPVE
jgi:hypothetical protein